MMYRQKKILFPSGDILKEFLSISPPVGKEAIVIFVWLVPSYFANQNSLFLSPPLENSGGGGLS
jgi:hypothetical protein